MCLTKNSKCINFDEIFYYDMTKLRKTNLDVFIQCQYWTSSVAKKYSKFQKFDEIFYYWMTRFRDKLRVFILENINTEKAILIKKIWDRIVLRNFQNSENFNLSNFTLTWSNEGKMNSVGSDMTCSKEIQEKMKMLDKLSLKNIWIKQF